MKKKFNKIRQCNIFSIKFLNENLPMDPSIKIEPNPSNTYRILHPKSRKDKKHEMLALIVLVQMKKYPLPEFLTRPDTPKNTKEKK
jgi:hypothetical protein